MGRNIRKIPEINAGSMADIAFLLLIFFLVTTTMDADKGINRKLPPWDPDRPETPDQIRKKNIFTVLINSNDQLLLRGEDYVQLSEVREATKAFIINNGDASCDYCQEGLRDPNSSDNPSKAVVSLQNDRGTSYDMYIKVQNELVAAYEDLRNEYSMKKYGKKYTDLPDAALIEEVKEKFPQNISEAEPIDLGGQ